MNNLMVKIVVAVSCVVLNPALWYVNAAVQQRSHAPVLQLCGAPGGDACVVLASRH